MFMKVRVDTPETNYLYPMLKDLFHSGGIPKLIQNTTETKTHFTK